MSHLHIHTTAQACCAHTQFTYLCKCLSVLYIHDVCWLLHIPLHKSQLSHHMGPYAGTFGYICTLLTFLCHSWMKCLFFIYFYIVLCTISLQWHNNWIDCFHRRHFALSNTGITNNTVDCCIALHHIFMLLVPPLLSLLGRVKMSAVKKFDTSDSFGDDEDTSAPWCHWD